MADRWRSALITGASSGIGRALALELARGGTRRLVLVARRAEELARVAAEVSELGGEAAVEVLDVADADRCAARMRELDDAMGGLDLVVANAGQGAPSGANPLAWETLRGPLHVNFCGAAATLTGALPAMIARGRGHLVGIGSLASYGPLPEAAAYCSPKAGLSMLLACLAMDLEDKGVAVTDVRLGFVKTAMVARSTHPMPQLAEPEDVARHVVHRLLEKPRQVVYPRALGAATRVFALAPEAVRRRVLGRASPGRSGS